MKKIRNNKGFTLVELLAVIVVLAIVMGLAVVGITSVLDNTRKSAFASDAKSFIQGARSLVNSDQANALLGDATTYAPSCVTGGTVYLPIELIPLEQGGKSPYGVAYSKGTATAKQTSAPSGSYVAVVATVTNGACEIKYGIYLTDTVKELKGTTTANTLVGKALKEDNISAELVNNKSA